LAVEFPAIGTGNFLLQTGKDTALTANRLTNLVSRRSMFAPWPEADIRIGQEHVGF
jgi:hypothetical protein